MSLFTTLQCLPPYFRLSSFAISAYAVVFISIAQAADAGQTELYQGSGIYTETQPAPFPNIPFYDASGSKQMLKDLQGHVVLINFWAKWCAPCIREMPTLYELQRRYPDRLKVIFISEDQQGFETINAFLEEQKLANTNHYHDKDNTIFRSLRMKGLPMSFIINRQGMLLATIQGEADWLGEAFNEWLKTQIAKDSP